MFIPSCQSNTMIWESCELWLCVDCQVNQVTRPKASNRTPKEHLSNSSICQAKCRAYLSGALEHLGTAIGTASSFHHVYPPANMARNGGCSIAMFVKTAGFYGFFTRHATVNVYLYLKCRPYVLHWVSALWSKTQFVKLNMFS